MNDILRKALSIQGCVFFAVLIAAGAYAISTAMEMEQLGMLMFGLVVVDGLISLIVSFKYKGTDEQNENG